MKAAEADSLPLQIPSPVENAHAAAFKFRESAVDHQNTFDETPSSVAGGRRTTQSERAETQSSGRSENTLKEKSFQSVLSFRSLLLPPPKLLLLQ